MSNMNFKLKQFRSLNDKLLSSLLVFLLVFIAPCGTRNTAQRIVDLPVTEQLNPAKSNLNFNQQSSNHCNTGFAKEKDRYTSTTAFQNKSEKQIDDAFISPSLHLKEFSYLYNQEAEALCSRTSYQNIALYILYNRPKLLPLSNKSVFTAIC